MKQLVIMPGGFHPFHAGHLALYQSALEAFPGADVKVAATNDTSSRPFPFKLKEKLAQLAGVPPGDFYQVKSPFRADEITRNYDPADTQLIFVRSRKDAGKPPVPGGIKKDGTPGYLQPVSNNMAPMTQHAYMAYLPTVTFGPGMQSATEIRTAWPQLDERRRMALVMSLYPHTQKNPKLAKTVVQMLDTAMGTEAQNVNEQVGGGEGESQWAAKRASDLWTQYARDNKTVTKWIYDTIQRRTMQFYQLGGNRDFQGGANTALQDAANAVDQDFQGIYRMLEKDKESSSLGKAMLGSVLGMQNLARDEQWKMTGSMNRANLAPTAEKFVQIYTDSLNRTLQSLQKQLQQPVQQNQPLKQITPQDLEKLTLGVVLYIFAKEDQNTNISNQITQSFSKIIQTYNNKDQINQLYTGILNQHNQEKIKDPAAIQRVKKSLYDVSSSILNDLNSLTSSEEFKEEVTRQMSQGGLRASYQDKYNQPMMEDYLDEARS